MPRFAQKVQQALYKPKKSRLLSSVNIKTLKDLEETLSETLKRKDDDKEEKS